MVDFRSHNMLPCSAKFVIQNVRKQHLPVASKVQSWNHETSSTTTLHRLDQNHSKSKATYAKIHGITHKSLDHTWTTNTCTHTHTYTNQSFLQLILSPISPKSRPLVRTSIPNRPAWRAKWLQGSHPNLPIPLHTLPHKEGYQAYQLEFTKWAG